MRVGIIGAGKGGLTFLKALLPLPDMQIVAIADPNPNAPGMVKARQAGVHCYADFSEMLQKEQMDLVIEVTGRQEVYQKLIENRSPDLEIISASTARLLMTLVEKLEHEYIDANVKLAQTLYSSIQQITASMQQVASGSEKLASRGQSLVESGNQVTENLNESSEVISFIQRIATQTKMIGLNAAIEAARVGEAGRGFSVVAGEVRKLAEDSAASTEKITRILQNVRLSVEQIINAIHEAAEVAQSQAAATQEVAAALQQISALAQKLNTEE